MIALALLLAAQSVGAKLIIMGPQQPTVISYVTMQKCLAAKAEIEKQAAERAQKDYARSGAVTLTGPAVYCVPA